MLNLDSTGEEEEVVDTILVVVAAGVDNVNQRRQDMIITKFLVSGEPQMNNK